MKHGIKARFVCVGAILSGLLASGPAWAYNYDTHHRMVESVLYISRHHASAPTPSPKPADWDKYMADVNALSQRLGVLRSGIGDQEGDKSNEADSNPKPWVGDPSKCGYDPKDNMSVMRDVKLSDLKYVPRRTKTVDGCGSTVGHADTVNQVYGTPMGGTLGWLAASVDDHLHDVVLWVRPTNALGAGAVKSFLDEVGKDVVGSLLVPVVCAWELLTGGDCDPNDAYDLANQYNPADIVDSMFPGFGSITDSQYVGLWHFIDVAEPGGQYNNPRGMLYSQAGPNGVPGALDTAIMVGCDLSGLSVRPDESDGVHKYAKFDDYSRRSTKWQAYSMGHIEFSPIDNLAQYGWNQYLVYGPDYASGLAWPLHALGDAAEPQHVAGTTGWGHRPFEDWVEHDWDYIADPTDDNIQGQVLAAGYHWWKVFSGQQDVRNLVTQLAVSTHNIVHQEGDWPYDDLASITYFVNKYQAWSSFRQYRPLETPIMTNGEGAILAFLIGASKHAQDDVPVDSTCPPNTHWDGSTCAPGSVPISEGGTPPVNVCSTGSVCDGGGGTSTDAGDAGSGCSNPCNVDSDCSGSDVCYSHCCEPPLH